MSDNKAGIDIRYAKSGDYKDTLESIIKTDKCPFCPDNFKYHKKPILRRYKGWCVTENSWPYVNSQYHFILISTPMNDLPFPGGPAALPSSAFPFLSLSLSLCLMKDE